MGSAKVHTGFLEAYNHVAAEVISVVKSQLASNPSYSVVVTGKSNCDSWFSLERCTYSCEGHSLGGALASLAAVSLKSAVPSAKLKLYTYGQPRVGNAAFASLVESRLGIANIFRAVHTYDGVPTFLLKSLGYVHLCVHDPLWHRAPILTDVYSANELWNFQEPPNAANVRQCNGGEDASCSNSIREPPTILFEGPGINSEI